MKKILSILLCLFMLFGVVGCVPGNGSNQNVIVGEYEVLNDGKGFLTNSEWKKAFKCLDRLYFEMKEEKYTPTKECFVVKTKKNTEAGEEFITYYLDFYANTIVYTSSLSKDTAYAVIEEQPFKELGTIFSTASIRLSKEKEFSVEAWKNATPYERGQMINDFDNDYEIVGIMTKAQLKEYLGEPDLEVFQGVGSRLTYLLYEKGDDNVGYVPRAVRFEVGNQSIIYGYYLGRCYEYTLSFTQTEGEVFNQTELLADTYLEGSQVDIYTEVLPNAELAMYIDGALANGGYETTYQGKNAWKYSFLMPSHSVRIDFKRENENCMDVKTLLSMPKLAFEDIEKVRWEQGYVEKTGGLGGYMNIVRYSSSSHNIANVLAILEYSVKEDQTTDWQENIGPYFLYSIFTKDERYDIKISREHIEVGGKYYTYLGQTPEITSPCEGGNIFVPQRDSYDVYAYTNGTLGNCVGVYKKLAEVEFQYTYEVKDIMPVLCIRTEFGDIEVLSENLFRFDGEGVYKVTNGINLLAYEA